MAQPRVPITLGRKQEAITWIDEHGQGVPSRAAVHFRQLGWKVDASTFRQWWRQREEIMDADPNQKRLKGDGRKPALGALEDLLLDAIIDRHLRKEKVSHDWIADRAREMYAETGSTVTFTATPEWVSKFMRRNDLSLRRRTNLTILSDEQLVGRAVSYMKFLCNHRPLYNPQQTVLMDETAVFFEDTHNTTVDLTGARHVVIKSTGFASMRITAALAVTAAGRKLTPLVIWKSTSPPKEFSVVSSVDVAYQQKAWVDSDLLCRWIDRVFPQVMTVDGKALVWDSMRAHISKKVKAKCAQRDIAMAVVPGGLTPYVQAGDIGIFKVFKDNLGHLINEWKESDAVEYTRSGSLRPPPLETVCTWVRKAWKDTPTLVVQNSIEAAGYHDDPQRWFIWNHDVYGWRFREKWRNYDQEEHKESGDPFNMDDIETAVDDVLVVEE